MTTFVLFVSITLPCRTFQPCVGKQLQMEIQIRSCICIFNSLHILLKICKDNRELYDSQFVHHFCSISILFEIVALATSTRWKAYAVVHFTSPIFPQFTVVDPVAESRIQKCIHFILMVRLGHKVASLPPSSSSSCFFGCCRCWFPFYNIQIRLFRIIAFMRYDDFYRRTTRRSWTY